MAKKKKKKSILKSRFYQIYFVLVALALVAIGIGTAVLTNNLRDYESAQPVYVAERVAALFEDGDYERIYLVDTSAKAMDPPPKIVRSNFAKGLHSSMVPEM